MERDGVTQAVTPFSTRRERGNSFMVPPPPQALQQLDSLRESFHAFGSSIASFFTAPSHRSLAHRPSAKHHDQHDVGGCVPEYNSSPNDSKAVRGLEPGGPVPGAFNIRRRARGEVPAWGRENNADVDDFEEYDNSTAAPSDGMIQDSTTSSSTYGEAYADEYDLASVTPVYDTANRKKHHCWLWNCALLGVTLVVAGIAVGVFVIVARGRSKSDIASFPSGRNELLCDLAGMEQPDIQQQCDCNDIISVLSEDTLVRYELLTPILGDSPDWSLCSSQNIALMTLATHSDQVQDEELCNRYALMVLFLSMDGRNWARQDGWGLGEPDDLCPCCMYGISCEGDSVVAINLQSNGVSGSIPSEIGLLTALTVLDLSRNKLVTGSLPTELGLLTDLVVLSMASNSLHGPLPSHLGRLTHLQTFDVTSNALTSSLPSELGELTSLEFLLCHFNRLTGSLPSELERLTRLQELDLGESDISHNGPLFAWTISTLRRINAAKCGIAGSLPSDALQFLTVLTDLTLGTNSLTGTLPTELALMTELQTLRLDNNRLQGPLPEELPMALVELSLFDNALTGTIPGAFGNLVNLKAVDLYGNGLTGTVSNGLCELVQSGQLTTFTTDCDFDGFIAKVECPYPDCCTECGMNS